MKRSAQICIPMSVQMDQLNEVDHWIQSRRRAWRVRNTDTLYLKREHLNLVQQMCGYTACLLDFDALHRHRPVDLKEQLQVAAKINPQLIPCVKRMQEVVISGCRQFLQSPPTNNSRFMQKWIDAVNDVTPTMPKEWIHEIERSRAPLKRAIQQIQARQSDEKIKIATARDITAAVDAMIENGEQGIKIASSNGQNKGWWSRLSFGYFSHAHVQAQQQHSVALQYKDKAENFILSTLHQLNAELSTGGLDTVFDILQRSAVCAVGWVKYFTAATTLHECTLHSWEQLPFSNNEQKHAYQPRVWTQDVVSFLSKVSLEVAKIVRDNMQVGSDGTQAARALQTLKLITELLDPTRQSKAVWQPDSAFAKAINSPKDDFPLPLPSLVAVTPDRAQRSRPRTRSLYQRNRAPAHSQPVVVVRQNPKSLKAAMILCVVACTKNVVQIQDKLSSAFCSKNVQDIQSCMDILKRLDPLVQGMMELGEVQADTALKRATADLLGYLVARQQLKQAIVGWKEGVLVSFLGHEAVDSPNSTDRDAFFAKVSQQFQPIKVAVILGEHVEATWMDVDGAAAECESHLLDEVKKLRHNCLALAKKVPGCRKEKCSQLNRRYDSFRSIQEHFELDSVQAAAKSAAAFCDGHVAAALDKYQRRLLRQSSSEKFADMLVALKHFAVHAPNFAMGVNERIGVQILGSMVRQRDGAAMVLKIGEELKRRGDDATALLLINDVPAFASIKTFLRNTQTLAFTIEDVLKEVDGDGIDTDSLASLHAQFQNQYWKEFVEPALADPDPKSHLKKVAAGAKKVARDARCLEWGTPASTAAIVQLLGRIFAYWTLDNLSEAYRANEDDLTAARNYLLQPHAAQVVAIMRLLDLVSPDPAAASVGAAPAPSTRKSKRHAAKRGSDDAKGTGQPPKKKKKKSIGARRSARSPAEKLKSAEKLKTVKREPRKSRRHVFVINSDDSGDETQWRAPQAPAIDVDAECAGVLGHLQNHLVEILTGEGKSVTLAVTAVVLALLGSDVDCACYSEYLSARDFNDFKMVFLAFGVEGQINYGTFNSLCEKFLNLDVNVRAATEYFISGTPSGPDHASMVAVGSQRSRALLIDEVDVFFGEDFYGNQYTPLASLQDETIEKLILHVWASKDTASYKRISKSACYLACVARFPEWKVLITSAVYDMLRALEALPTHEYVVHMQQIAYKEQDGITTRKNFGFLTIFAYLQEFDNGEIPKSVLKKRLLIPVNCGSFSYADIPQRYSCILGVTGTLRALAGCQKQMLADQYNIKRNTFMPSVYGSNQRIFSGDSPQYVHIETAASFHSGIMKMIEAPPPSGDGRSRAVFVFFEDAPKLRAFRESRHFAGLKHFAKVMTEETPAEEKTGLINQAATKGNVVLLTREFGRGTDFACYDGELDKAGGVHVIQTFVSEMKSEEIQIQGRTARQGKNGSFGMILLDSDLERVGINLGQVKEMKQTSKLYSTIDRFRNQHFNSRRLDALRSVGDISKEHRSAMKFLVDLKKSVTPGALYRKSARDEAKHFLCSRNETMPHGVSNRTLVLMDATCSMSKLLDKAKLTVANMFDSAHRVLAEQQDNSEIEIQFACYRNYSSEAHGILVSSQWESTPYRLRSFMREIRPSGGQGREAVEIGLAHANKEVAAGDDGNTVAQIILIGDMPPNTPAEVRQRRADCRGEKYWIKCGFRLTSAAEEVKLLAEAGVPVHGFYVKDDARDAFSHISSTTGGKSGFLDIDSPNGANQLEQLVTGSVLYGIGGDAYVTKYKEMLKRKGVGYLLE